MHDLCLNARSRETFEPNVYTSKKDQGRNRCFPKGFLDHSFVSLAFTWNKHYSTDVEQTFLPPCYTYVELRTLTRTEKAVESARTYFVFLF